MNPAYIYFGKPITAETCAALNTAVRTLAYDQDHDGNHFWGPLKLSISSGGGDMVAAFGAYHEISSIADVELHTHNSGAVDSAAILLFLTGRRRTASPSSAFMFHQTVWTFNVIGQTRTQIDDVSRWLRIYDGYMAEAIAAGSRLSVDDAKRMMREGASLTAQEALEVGLVHAVENMRTARNIRSWQI